MTFSWRVCRVRGAAWLRVQLMVGALCIAEQPGNNMPEIFRLSFGLRYLSVDSIAICIIKAGAVQRTPVAEPSIWALPGVLQQLLKSRHSVHGGAPMRVFRVPLPLFNVRS
jgi:hypothetical protein